MIDFIILEDNTSVIKDITKIIKEKTFEIQNNITIHEFTDYCEDFEELVRDETLNKVYILDIELPNKSNGIEIARRIRLSDLDSNIIMITGHGGLFEAVYRGVYNLFDFIEKLGGYQNKLAKDIDLIINHKFDNASFNYHNRDINLQILYKNILYIYRDTCDRKIMIVTDCNSYSLPIPLADLTEKLDKRFIKVHRACIVNKNHVEKYNWAKGYFVLDNGLKVDLLSKKYREDVTNG